MCAMTTFFHESDPVVHRIRLNKLRALKNVGGRDRAVLTFDVKADLRTVWNWNVKNLFVFVVAEYETSKHNLNQVVIWDKIVQKQEDALIDYSDVYNKYDLKDYGSRLRKANVNLTVHWDIMPMTGRLYSEKQGFNSFQLPGKYRRSAGRKKQRKKRTKTP